MSKPPANEKAKSPNAQSVESSELLAMWLLTFSQLYHQEVEELAVLAYRESLKEFSSKQIDRGCREAIRRCTFMPKPADIIDCIWETRPAAPELQSLPEPTMTREQIKEFFSAARERLGNLLKDKPTPDGVIRITDEMRADYERKKQEALERFETGSRSKSAPIGASA